MTEAGGVATATQKAEALDHPDSCGIGSIFTEVAVQAGDGSVAAPGEQGEIVVRGPGVTPGYWEDSETTAAAIRDGWLHSGDLGTRDPQGRITVVARTRTLTIPAAINTPPVKPEAPIAALAGVPRSPSSPPPTPASV